jgi:hypothetical protein
MDLGTHRIYRRRRNIRTRVGVSHCA